MPGFRFDVAVAVAGHARVHLFGEREDVTVPEAGGGPVGHAMGLQTGGDLQSVDGALAQLAVPVHQRFHGVHAGTTAAAAGGLVDLDGVAGRGGRRRGWHVGERAARRCGCGGGTPGRGFVQQRFVARGLEPMGQQPRSSLRLRTPLRFRFRSSTRLPLRTTLRFGLSTRPRNRFSLRPRNRLSTRPRLPQRLLRPRTPRIRATRHLRRVQARAHDRLAQPLPAHASPSPPGKAPANWPCSPVGRAPPPPEPTPPPEPIPHPHQRHRPQRQPRPPPSPPS